MSRPVTSEPAAGVAVGGSLLRAGTRRRHLRTAAPGRTRRAQIALGAIWLCDGALQLQPFMFHPSIVTRIIAPNEAGQPELVAAPISLAAHLIEPRVALFNALAATIQLLIGIGLLHRRSVRLALAGSFAWALAVWWVGEGLGGLLTETASPLTGAPGAALLYVLAGMILWPRTSRSNTHRPTAGLLGDRGARGIWATLWLGSAALWLTPANRAANAAHDAIASAPSGAGWLSSLQSAAASATAGHGLPVAILAAILSAAIGLGGLSGRRATPVMIASIALALFYLVVGQGLGGILTGAGTDPGSGPLLILLAFAVLPPRPETRTQAPGSSSPRRRRRASNPNG